MLENVVKIKAYLGDKKILKNILIDTGAAVNLLDKLTWEEIGKPFLEVYDEKINSVKSSQPLNILGVTKIKLSLKEVILDVKFVVSENLTQECILGAPFLYEHDCRIEFKKGCIQLLGISIPIIQIKGEEVDVKMFESVKIPANHAIFIEAVADIPLKGDIVFEPKQIPNLTSMPVLTKLYKDRRLKIQVWNQSCDEVILYKYTHLGTIQNADVHTEDSFKCINHVGVNVNGNFNGDIAELFDWKNCAGTREEKERLKNVMRCYEDVISKFDGDVGRTDVARHEIDTGTHKPVKIPPRRIPLGLREEAEKIVKDMQQKGVIRESISSWSSPIVLVKKKDGKLRFCVDYRELNKITVKDAYPLPRINDILDTLGGAAFYSTLDLTSGYWQMEVDEKDRCKTAFSYGRGLYEFNVLPFGVCNGPASFQRLMEEILGDCVGKICSVYFDDLIVYGKNEEEHLKNLQTVLMKFRKAGMKIRPDKCELFRDNVKFLGHMVSKDGIFMDPAKVKAIINWAAPTNLKELETFLGTCMYYKIYIKNFSEIVAPLTKLTRKNEAFRWGVECKKAFEEIKKCMTTSPVLAYPVIGIPFVLDTDASNSGLGAVLSQEIDGKERIIANFSRMLNKPERKYCVTRKELLGLVDSIKYFKQYLLGQKFLLRTDHSSLKWLTSFKDPEGQVARWLERLSEFNFDIEYRPGKKHGNADGLSRCKQCGDINEEIIINEEIVQEEPQVVCLVNLAPDVTIQSEEWKEAQKNDDEIGNVYSAFLNNQFEEEATKFIDKVGQCHITANGLLATTRKNGNKEVEIVIVPKVKRKEILELAHDHRLSGHMGISKTVKKLKERFYWPKLSRDVIEYIKTCQNCQQTKPGNKKRFAEMKNIKVSRIMEKIGIDIVGPVEATPDGYKYLLVIVEYFSKWAEAIPIKNQEAKTVANALMNEFICRYGVPESIHTDQGRNFDSELIQELCKLLSSKKTRTTAYHPQSDGLVERTNRTIKNLVRPCMGKENWMQVIPQIMFAYRSSVHESTGYTPAELWFGRQYKLPLDLLKPTPDTTPYVPHSEYVEKLKESIESNFMIAAGNDDKKKMKQKVYYDRKAFGKPYEENDLVWLEIQNQKKFGNAWNGPFMIEKKLNDCVYVIKDPKNKLKKKTVHFNKLKPCIQRNDEGQKENEVIIKKRRENDIDFGMIGGALNCLRNNICDVPRNVQVQVEVHVPEPIVEQARPPARRLSQIPVPRRERRIIRPPVRYDDYLMQ